MMAKTMRFTIPRRSDSKQDVTRTAVARDGREWTTVVKSILKSLGNRAPDHLFSPVLQVEMVANRPLERAADSWRKEKREIGYKAGLELVDADCFLAVLPQQADAIARNGLAADEQCCVAPEELLLGDPSLGVNVFKRADDAWQAMASKLGWEAALRLQLVVFHVYQGVCRVASGTMLEPMPNYDSLVGVCKSTCSASSDLVPMRFVYDFDPADYSIMKRPRQLRPYAIVTLRVDLALKSLRLVSFRIPAPISQSSEAVGTCVTKPRSDRGSTDSGVDVAANSVIVPATKTKKRVSWCLPTVHLNEQEDTSSVKPVSVAQHTVPSVPSFAFGRHQESVFKVHGAKQSNSETSSCVPPSRVSMDAKSCSRNAIINSGKSCHLLAAGTEVRLSSGLPTLQAETHKADGVLSPPGSSCRSSCDKDGPLYGADDLNSTGSDRSELVYLRQSSGKASVSADGECSSSDIFGSSIDQKQTQSPPSFPESQTSQLPDDDIVVWRGKLRGNAGACSVVLEAQCHKSADMMALLADELRFQRRVFGMSKLQGRVPPEVWSCCSDLIVEVPPWKFQWLTLKAADDPARAVIQCVKERLVTAKSAGICRLEAKAGSRSKLFLVPERDCAEPSGMAALLAIHSSLDDSGTTHALSEPLQPVTEASTHPDQEDKTSSTRPAPSFPHLAAAVPEHSDSSQACLPHPPEYQRMADTNYDVNDAEISLTLHTNVKDDATTYGPGVVPSGYNLSGVDDDDQVKEIAPLDSSSLENISSPAPGQPIGSDDADSSGISSLLDVCSSLNEKLSQEVSLSLLCLEEKLHSAHQAEEYDPSAMSWGYASGSDQDDNVETEHDLFDESSAGPCSQPPASVKSPESCLRALPPQCYFHALPQQSEGSALEQRPACITDDPQQHAGLPCITASPQHTSSPRRNVDFSQSQDSNPSHDWNISEVAFLRISEAGLSLSHSGCDLGNWPLPSCHSGRFESDPVYVIDSSSEEQDCFSSGQSFPCHLPSFLSTDTDHRCSDAEQEHRSPSPALSEMSSLSLDSCWENPLPVSCCPPVIDCESGFDSDSLVEADGSGIPVIVLSDSDDSDSCNECLLPSVVTRESVSDVIAVEMNDTVSNSHVSCPVGDLCDESLVEALPGPGEDKAREELKPNDNAEGGEVCTLPVFAPDASEGLFPESSFSRKPVKRKNPDQHTGTGSNTFRPFKICHRAQTSKSVNIFKRLGSDNGGDGTKSDGDTSQICADSSPSLGSGRPRPKFLFHTPSIRSTSLTRNGPVSIEMGKNSDAVSARRKYLRWENPFPRVLQTTPANSVQIFVGSIKPPRTLSFSKDGSASLSPESAHSTASAAYSELYSPSSPLSDLSDMSLDSDFEILDSVAESDVCHVSSSQGFCESFSVLQSKSSCVPPHSVTDAPCSPPSRFSFISDIDLDNPEVTSCQSPRCDCKEVSCGGHVELCSQHSLWASRTPADSSQI